MCEKLTPPSSKDQEAIPSPEAALPEVDDDVDDNNNNNNEDNEEDDATDTDEPPVARAPIKTRWTTAESREMFDTSSFTIPGIFCVSLAEFRWITHLMSP